ncbi:hypothetical protein DFJ74DRAFT_687480 [Hyaloraphidium curvatum]|nr:hypothetical protein DFJ74DRAFT_687480 [Hyaloraphidium curvatum]
MEPRLPPLPDPPTDSVLRGLRDFSNPTPSFLDGARTTQELSPRANSGWRAALRALRGRFEALEGEVEAAREKLRGAEGRKVKAEEVRGPGGLRSTAHRFSRSQALQREQELRRAELESLRQLRGAVGLLEEQCEATQRGVENERAAEKECLEEAGSLNSKLEQKQRQLDELNGQAADLLARARTNAAEASRRQTTLLGLSAALQDRQPPNAAESGIADEELAATEEELEELTRSLATAEAELKKESEKGDALRQITERYRDQLGTDPTLEVARERFPAILARS